MKILDEINTFRKNAVYEKYIRCCYDIKEYEKITRKEMVLKVYKEYKEQSGYGLLDICTIEELRFLEMLIKNNNSYKANLNGDKYDWEIDNLENKFLLTWKLGPGYFTYSIPEEIIDTVKEVLKDIDWKKQEGYTHLMEMAVSYVKVMGDILLDVVVGFCSTLSSNNKEDLKEGLYYCKLFNYYVGFYDRYVEFYDRDELAVYYRDYEDYIDDLNLSRKKQFEKDHAQGRIIEFNYNSYISIFFNDFDLTNSVIKKFIDKLDSLEINSYYLKVIKFNIRISSLLNDDREELKKWLTEFLESLGISINIQEFFQDLDIAMNEMYSATLNGITPNKNKEEKAKNALGNFNKDIEYIPQRDAHLSKSDVTLFYKLYFGVLEYTNKLYNINPGFKIYKQKGINPMELKDIVNKFWENKNEIIDKFRKENPFKFSKQELDSLEQFKEGKRGMYVIVKFEDSYTQVLSEDKLYMVKGITGNIDEIISYKNLPMVVNTTILPFNGNLIYDSLLYELPISLSSDINELFINDAKKMKKSYHM